VFGSVAQAAVVSNRHGTRTKRENGLNARRISRYLLPKRIQVDDQCHTHADGSCSLLPARNDVYKCWGYMGAVQDLSGAVDDTGKPVLGYCPDPKTTLTQLIRVFTNYARPIRKNYIRRHLCWL